jgi:hypothetical protein
MKFLPLVFAFALVGSNASKVSDVEDVFNEVMEIIGGIFVGMSLDVKAQDVAPCVKDAGSIGQDLEQAYYYYKLGTYTGKIKALALVAAAEQQVSDAMKECKAGSVEAGEAIARMVLAWKDPLSVLTHMGENLVVNGADIMAEVSYAMNAWEYKNYFDFGFYIGEAGFKVLYVPPAKPSIDSKSLEALFKSLTESLNFSPPTTSFSDSIIEKLDSSFSHDFDFGGIADFIVELGEAMEMMITELEENNEELKVCEKIKSAVKSMIEPTSLAVVRRFIVLNGIHLNHFMSLKMNYLNSDWSGVGHYMGLTLKSLI